MAQRLGILGLAILTEGASLIGPHRLGRREVLKGSTALSVLAPSVSPHSLAAIEAPPPMVDVPTSAFRRIPGGGQLADLRVGSDAA
jgi:hypothetical protein